jgi:hypothetical protein
MECALNLWRKILIIRDNYKNDYELCEIAVKQNGSAL